MSTFYEIDGERFPRVTAVCAVVANDRLSYWRGRIGNDQADRVSREATTLGTQVHRAAEHLNRGSAPSSATPDAVWPLYRAYEAWFREHVRSVVAAEKLVISRLHRYAGTADLVAFLDDDEQPAVIDIKTSNSTSESWNLQLAAYQLGLEEDNIECARRVIVQLPSREPGVCNVYDLDDAVRDQRAFLNALKLYRWREGFKPTEPTGPRIRFSGRTR